jgi:hypothetical protein
MRRLVALALAALLCVAPASALAQEADPAVAPAPLSVPPLDVNTCPDTHPIKGNKAGRQANRPADPIYHIPSSRWYAVTDPEECFATVEDAVAAGYRAPLR